jgi:hypothetical protein
MILPRIRKKLGFTAKLFVGINFRGKGMQSEALNGKSYG